MVNPFHLHLDPILQNTVFSYPLTSATMTQEFEKNICLGILTLGNLSRDSSSIKSNTSRIHSLNVKFLKAAKIPYKKQILPEINVVSTTPLGKKNNSSQVVVKYSFPQDLNSIQGILSPIIAIKTSAVATSGPVVDITITANDLKQPVAKWFYNNVLQIMTNLWRKATSASRLLAQMHKPFFKVFFTIEVGAFQGFVNVLIKILTKNKIDLSHHAKITVVLLFPLGP